MTLLIGILSKSKALLTADGRSRQLQCGQLVFVNDRCQKIFPVKAAPLAFVHHGENVFKTAGGQDGSDAATRIGQFIDRNASSFSTSTVTEVVERLIRDIEEEVLHTLDHVRRVCGEETAMGIWIVGFGRDEDHPQASEVF